MDGFCCLITQRTLRLSVQNDFMEINDITSIIIEESIKIHSDLGPGLFESVYEEILSYRLVKRGLNVQKQVAIPCFMRK